MLTFEKVLEIFADYLAADKTIEVYISRHGCVRVEFDQDFHYCTGEVCHTPRELFDLLSDDYRTYLEIELTKGRRELTEDAVVYDIGAGTGSVSVEIALSGEKIKVYAIEKNPEGVELIRQNRKKFRVDGIRIIEGNAPEVLEGLEMPTHVFIGGSSGNLRQIIEKVTDANPEVKIVLNAISLETLGEVMELSKDGLLKEIQVTQLSAARSRILGDYHMMTGQNPVYIIRSERRATET